MTVTCPKCSANFVDKAHLKSHLDRKYPCTSGGFECNKCHKKFQQRCGRDRHQKRCLGIRETIESLKGRISTLEKDIKEPSNVLISDIKSVNLAPHIDQISNQVYFGIPGNLLKAVDKLDQEDTLIKVGSSDDFPTRISRHKRDFGGFRLLDSVITNNPKHVEKKFKDWLKVQNKMIKAKTIKKKSVDSEIFVVKTQKEYEEIIAIAIKFADDYRKEVEENSSNKEVLILEQKRLDLEICKTQLQILQMGKPSSSN